MCPTSSNCAVITETAAINTSFSFYVAVRVLDTTHFVKMWNDLPADSTDFSSLNSFKRCLSSTLLARLFKVYFFLDVLDNVVTDYRR